MLRSQDRESAPPSRRRAQSVVSLPIWWMGIALVISGEVGNFAAYGARARVETTEDGAGYR
eukprot:3055695-Pleurochrysis_carterae.AAC.1